MFLGGISEPTNKRAASNEKQPNLQFFDIFSGRPDQEMIKSTFQRLTKSNKGIEYSALQSDEYSCRTRKCIARPKPKNKEETSVAYALKPGPANSKSQMRNLGRPTQRDFIVPFASAQGKKNLFCWR